MRDIREDAWGFTATSSSALMYASRNTLMIDTIDANDANDGPPRLLDVASVPRSEGRTL